MCRTLSASCEHLVSANSGQIHHGRMSARQRGASPSEPKRPLSVSCLQPHGVAASGKWDCRRQGGHPPRRRLSSARRVRRGEDAGTEAADRRRPQPALIAACSRALSSSLPRCAASESRALALWQSVHVPAVRHLVQGVGRLPFSGVVGPIAACHAGVTQRSSGSSQQPPGCAC
jgi:hypothetical protein